MDAKNPGRVSTFLCFCLKETKKPRIPNPRLRLRKRQNGKTRSPGTISYTRKGSQTAVAKKHELNAIGLVGTASRLSMGEKQASMDESVETQTLLSIQRSIWRMVRTFSSIARQEIQRKTAVETQGQNYQSPVNPGGRRPLFLQPLHPAAIYVIDATDDFQ